MKKVIKVIDLLNMIANGEEVPERIRVGKTIFKYDKSRKDYIHKIDDDGWQNETLLFRVMDTHFIEELIDAKVEILDEEDEIDIQSIKELDYVKDYEADNTDIRLNRDAIRQLTRAVKQLDNKLKEN